jgi:hypothetical protein
MHRDYKRHRRHSAFERFVTQQTAGQELEQANKPARRKRQRA